MKQAFSRPKNEAEAMKLAGITLTEDESFIATCVIHGAIFWKAVVVIVLGMLMLPTFAFSLGVFLMFVGGIMLGLAWLTRHFLILAATNKRVFIRSGVVYADMIELR